MNKIKLATEEEFNNMKDFEKVKEVLKAFEITYNILTNKDGVLDKLRNVKLDEIEYMVLANEIDMEQGYEGSEIGKFINPQLKIVIDKIKQKTGFKGLK